MKKRDFVLLIVSVAMVTTMGFAATTLQAQMMANVAAGKPVTAITEFGYYGDARMSPPFAVDEQLRSITGYVSQRYQDDVWWQVDLGAQFHFDQITVYGRMLTDAHLHLNGAYLCAYDDTHAEIATEVLSGYFYGDGPDTWIQDWSNGGSGWSGVRYIAVEDRDGVLNVYNDALNLNEVVARTEIPTYPTYLTNVTATGNMLYRDGAHADVQYELMINGSGMSDQTGVPGEMLFGSPDATARQIHGGHWTSGAVSTELPELIYDLQGSCDLDRMLVWNLCKPDFLDHGLQEVMISTSDDGTTYTDLPDNNGGLEQGNYTIAMSPGGNAPYQADIDLTGVTARYVRLVAMSSYGKDDWGLSEVRFYGDRTITEIPGDADHSGTVDATDAGILAENWGMSGAVWMDGDFNGDGNVGPIDASIMAANWGYGLPTESSTVVPEPNTLLLLASLLSVVFLKRRVD